MMSPLKHTLWRIGLILAPIVLLVLLLIGISWHQEPDRGLDLIMLVLMVLAAYGLLVVLVLLTETIELYVKKKRRLANINLVILLVFSAMMMLFLWNA